MPVTIPTRALLLLFLILAGLPGGGCSFKRAWNQAASPSDRTRGIEGRWEGNWLSEANGHKGRIRCLVTKETEDVYHARYHATFWKVFRYAYTVRLHTERTNNHYHFTGEEDLGWLAGGAYHYEGHATPDRFFATYRSKYDHGIFQMARPRTDKPEPAGHGVLKLGENTRQLVVVTTPHWQSRAGALRRFERASPGADWQPVGPTVTVVVGRSGLAWGSGLHPGTDMPPNKREGDGKSPAGAFRLISAFGYPAPHELELMKLPYLQIQPGVECVDDSGSTHYNSLIAPGQVPRPDWTSSEKMEQFGRQYHLGVVVDHNPARLPGLGSCIFLHVWGGIDASTSGCTAMDERDMETLLYWLDPEFEPVLVQLPELEYNHLQSSWKTPKLQ